MCVLCRLARKQQPFPLKKSIRRKQKRAAADRAAADTERAGGEMKRRSEQSVQSIDRGNRHARARSLAPLRETSCTKIQAF